MAELTLKFAGDRNGYSLVESCFKHDELAKPLCCVRGGSLGAVDQRSFRWSQAVQALCLLMLKHASGCLTKGPSLEPAAIEGAEGSLALSLDYALGKQPQWLLSMFGADKSGLCYLRRFVQRINPEHKRPGPVQVVLPQRLQGYGTEFQVQVFADDEEVHSLASLQELQRRLNLSVTENKKEHKASTESFTHQLLLGAGNGLPTNGHINGHSNGADPGYGLFASHQGQSFLCQLLFNEAQEMLHSTELFLPHKLDLSLKRITKNSYFQKLVGRNREIPLSLEPSGYASQRIGLAADHAAVGGALRQEPLRIVVPPVLLGAVVVLTHLRDRHHFPLELDFSFPHATAFLQSLLHGAITELPDACVLTLANTAHLIGAGKRSGFRPFILMPKERYRIVSPVAANATRPSLGEGEYAFIYDYPSSQSYYFHELQATARVQRKNVSILNIEPWETIGLLRNGSTDLRAILCFPHYAFEQVFNDCVFVDNPADGLKETFLCCSQSLQAKPQLMSALNIAIRNAWLELLEEPPLLHNLVSGLAQDTEYLKMLTRTCGLFMLSEEQRRRIDEYKVDESKLVGNNGQ